MYSGKLQRTVPQASRPTVAPVQGRPPAVAYGAPPASQPPGFQARIDAAARFGHSLARLVGPPPPSAPVIQRMKDGEIEDGRYYLVRYQENQLTARLRGRKDGEYQLVVLGTNSVIRVSDPEDIIMPVRLGKSEKEPSREEQSGKKETRIKRTREDTEIEHPAKGPTVCVTVENGVPEAIVSEELVDAYLADLRDDPQHHLQEGEGQAIAHAMGVTAHVMAQVAGPLIQSTNLRYGNGAHDDGTLLHIGGNHYIVLHQVGPGVPADFVDTDGNGYAEGEKTVADGNCLIDGLHLIRDNQHATPEQIDQARAVAADAGGHDREGVRQILAATITDIVQGEPPGGIGTRTQAYIDRDPNIESARDELRQRKEQTDVEEDREESATPVTSDEEDGEGNVLMPQAPPLEEAENVKEEAGSRELEDAVTRYLLEVNRLEANRRGDEEARKLPEHRLVLELWLARYGRPAPSARALAHWLEERETKAHDYFGSDTESEGESASSSEEDEAEPIWTDEDYGLLGELNRDIAGAKDHGDIEKILRDERFQRFVVPQFRGIAYMTNRFSKAKRREHRRSSQAGKPVFADAVRPPEMSREEFYTRSHGKDSAVERRKSDLQKYLVEMRKPSPVVDPKRRIVNARRSGRIFPTRFHVLQSDYSQDYTKSAEKIAEHHQRGQSGTSEASASTSTSQPPSFDEQVYSGIPFRSHPFLSTSDQPGHAVRYALGNKPIAAEKAFRLRPRWRRGGKPQHPYSGKVYTSLHPLRDYLAPTAPSSVWMGRAQGTLSIDNDISKEGESSFLAAIKANRVVGEQVIRWPSLEESKDESGSHGLSAEERRQLRKILQEHPPHSKEQKGMKSGKLGQQVEKHYTDKVMNAANRAAVKRGQLLVYRNLEGGFSREPPIYKTPGASALERWERPATKKTEEKRLAAIREGKVKPGYLTEGFFHDWPSEELYAGLSDEEEGPVEVEDDPFEYRPLKRGQPLPETGRFLARCDSILKETRRALAALPHQRNVSFASMRAAGTRLVERAYARIHQTALAGWTQADLNDRHLALPPPAGAPGELEAWFRQMIAALEAEVEVLAQSWGPGEEDLLE